MSEIPTVTDCELAAAEAKVAFVRCVDERRADGMKGPAIWRAAYVEGYLRGLDPRSMEEVKQEMADMLGLDAAIDAAAKAGLTKPAWEKTR